MQGNGANAQWNSLPNYLEGSLERFIPVVDIWFDVLGNC
jgi:hypothetical protein